MTVNHSKRSKTTSRSKSTLKKRRSTVRRYLNNGGMHRASSSAAKKIFTEAFKGKNPLERADKAKDVIQAVLKGIEPQTQSHTPVRVSKVGTFSIRENMLSPILLSEISHSPKNVVMDVDLLKTPVKIRASTAEPKIPKTRRHRSSAIATPESYAPTLNNPDSNVIKGNLFE